MRQLLILFILILLAPGSWAKSAQPLVRADVDDVYIVKKGDTLWDISSHFLANPWLWPTLWQANAYIANPHLIYPGDQLHLVWADGQPRLRLKKTVKLSPSIRVTRSPITTLQQQLIFPYLAEHQLITPPNMTELPRVLGTSDERGYMVKGDTVWVDTALDIGEKWWVYRPETDFVRKGVQQKNIVSLQEIAKLEVTARKGQLSLLSVVSFRQEVHQNDLLLPAPHSGSPPAMTFSPSESTVDIQASVLGHLDGRGYIATSQVVVLDRGHLDGLIAGNVLQLYRPGAKVMGNKGRYHYQTDSKIGQKHQLSDIHIGEVMVIRPYDYFSLAVVTRSTEPFRAGVQAQPPHRVIYE
ncbi:LysM peptidoglycan-binding domain-containing protein [Photobacterium sagamiensis]|uniref:LysM peptidoglycan-binding domain-containing protein n=1 Tax=Photobacterium sagamiensis TaxID=2910241 RepID=UPI003D0BCFB5